MLCGGGPVKPACHVGSTGIRRTGAPTGAHPGGKMNGRQISVRGLVQGVGFRPYVWRLANELGLRGWVRNDGAGVTIAVDGQKLPEFINRLPNEAPRLARIDQIDTVAAEVTGEGFAILDSVAGEVKTAIGPDAAICPDCIADICDPAQSPLALCLHHLHALRAALYGQPADSLRSRADQPGRVPALPGLQHGIHRSGRPPFSCRNHLLSGMRPAAQSARCGWSPDGRRSDRGNPAPAA